MCSYQPEYQWFPALTSRNGTAFRYDQNWKRIKFRQNRNRNVSTFRLRSTGIFPKMRLFKYFSNILIKTRKLWQEQNYFIMIACLMVVLDNFHFLWSKDEISSSPKYSLSYLYYTLWLNFIFGLKSQFW